MTRILLAVWLLVLWLGLWRDLSVANLVSGLAVVALVLLVFPVPGAGRRTIVRPVPALRFWLRFLRDLVVSTAVVAWTVVTPRRRITTGIVAVPMRTNRPGMLTLVANSITLTPGTLTVEAVTDPAVLYVHVLDLRDLDEVRRSVVELEARIISAFGTDEEVALLGEGARNGKGAQR